LIEARIGTGLKTTAMANANDLVQTIGAIYAAGLDEKLWPRALAGVTRTVGGIAATLEVFDRKPVALTEFHSFGLPPANELAYLDGYAALNPRIPALVNGRAGGLVTDYTLMDESGMNRHAFYADFLLPVGYRYFIGGILTAGERQASLFSVQRARRQGHVDRSEAASMLALLPHMRNAFGLSCKLKATREAYHSLQAAFDWLADGVLVVTTDGVVSYANAAMQDIFRRGDGLRLMKNRLDVADNAARARYRAALASVARLHAGEPGGIGGEFAASRNGDAPPYLISVRPLAGGRPTDGGARNAIVFVQDPLRQRASAAHMLRDLFGLTQAEAALAVALQGGESVAGYAVARGLSRNTVYTHLRRLKEKTGVKRQPDLIRKLNDVKLPLRRD
jgi:DNA-binding CsgD family transcriptional regulator